MASTTDKIKRLVKRMREEPHKFIGIQDPITTIKIAAAGLFGAGAITNHIAGQAWAVFSKSLPNSPQSTQMPTRSGKRIRKDLEDDNDDLEQTMTSHEAPSHEHTATKGGISEGVEDQIENLGHIWKRFPNTETAALKWISTMYVDNSPTGAQGIAPKEPFDEPDQLRLTALTTTDGGAVVPVTNLDLFTVTTHGYDFGEPILFQLRMTSPYNILKRYQQSNTAILTPFVNGAGYSASNSGSQPTWIEHFDQKYQYYHVLETKWKAKINLGQPNNGTTQFGTASQPHAYYIFWRYTNQDVPPTTTALTANVIANATNVDPTRIQTQNMLNAPGVRTLTSDDYFRMGGWHHKRVSLSAIHQNHFEIGGTYRYGQCKMDIKTLLPSDAHGPQAIATAEGWQLTGATPAFPEDLSIIMVEDIGCRGNTNNVAGVFTPCSFTFETEQLIQFKDLEAAYKFPTSANSIMTGDATHIPTEQIFFMRGAGFVN